MYIGIVHLQHVLIGAPANREKGVGGAGLGCVIGRNIATVYRARIFVRTERETVMHKAPVPHPDHEPMEEDDSIPVPGVPGPDDDPVPDHNPS